MAKRSAQLLLTALKSISGTGCFHSRGALPFFLPELEVDGVGEIPFPLHPAMVEEIKKYAEPAPYGKGEETLLDEGVRRCWQVDATNFALRSAEWDALLKSVTETVATDLGVTGRVVAEPYKLLLYGEGGHFLPHRDTEKVGKMFATLIIALPSVHEGGKLLIRHDGKEVAVDFSGDGAKAKKGFQFAAFFADCEHEVRPVESGYRCCLVYNLRLKKGDPGKLNLPLTEQSRELVPHLEKLAKGLGDDFVAVLLEHRYTEANLSLKRLKNNDRARGHALMAAAAEVGLRAHLALVTFHQMGELLDGDGDYGYGRSKKRKSGGESMGEVYDESLTVGEWRNDKDRKMSFGKWRVARECVLSEVEIDAGDPHEAEAEGYTGNAGCTMDYWYHHAAIILWSPDVEESLLARENLDGACEELLRIAKHKSAKRFVLLGGAVIRKLAAETQKDATSQWDRGLGYHNRNRVVAILEAIAARGSDELLKQFLETVPAIALQACESKLWSALLKTFSADCFVPIFERLPTAELGDFRETLFGMVEALLEMKSPPASAAEMAAILLKFSPAEPDDPSFFERDKPMPTHWGDPGESHVLLAVSYLIEDADLRKLASAFLAGDGSLDHLRAVLAPALLGANLKKHFKHDRSLFSPFLDSAIAGLETEIGTALEAYPDFARPCPPLGGVAGGIGEELRAFLLDPETGSYEFKRRKDERDQVAKFVRRHLLDVDMTTIRKGTPHTLNCVKNKKSYARAEKRRKDDRALLVKLRKMLVRER